MTQERPTSQAQLAAYNAMAAFANVEDARAAIDVLERHGIGPANISLLEPPIEEARTGAIQALGASELRGLMREIKEGQVLVVVHSDDRASVDRAEELLRGTPLIYIDRFPAGRRRVEAERSPSRGSTEPGPRQEAAPALTQRYRVLRMEPLVGDDRQDPRTAPAPGAAGSAVGPDMHAAQGYEGQTVMLGQLEGMGRLTWEGDRVARLDTATESYRVELEPL